MRTAKNGLTIPAGALWGLVEPGVYRSPALDEGGYHQLYAVGENRRVLERVRVFKAGEENRIARYLQAKYALKPGGYRRCRQCREWFHLERQNRVRCRRCIDAGKRKDGGAS